MSEGTAPTFEWQSVSGATAYRLYVRRLLGGQSPMEYDLPNFAGEGDCSGDTCSEALPNILDNGEYVWWIQPRNAGCSEGPWSDPLFFSVKCGRIQSAQLLTPSGMTSTATPTYTWEKLDFAEEYWVWIETSSGTVLLDQRYPAADICGATTCSITPHTTPLTNGDYFWQVIGWSPCSGYGVWTGKQPFTINPTMSEPFTALYQLAEGRTEVFGDIRQTSDGGYIALGGSGNPAGNLNDHRNRDLWVVRLDATGQILWQKRYGQAQTWEWGKVILETPDHGYLIGGDTMNAPSDTNSDWDAVVMKFDAAGNMVWRFVYGKPDSLDSLTDLQLTSDGGYVFTGVNDFAWNTNRRDIWVVKLNADGSVNWQNSYHQDYDYGHFIHQTADNGYFVVGTSGLSPQLKKVLLKLDASGAILWQTQLTDSIGPIRDVAFTQDGGVLIASDNGGEVGFISMGLLKLDANGNRQWYQGYPGYAGMTVDSVEQTPDQRYMVIGSLQMPDAGRIGYWMRLTSTGVVETTTQIKRYSGQFADMQNFWVTLSTAAHLTNDGGVIVGGFAKPTSGAIDYALIMKLHENGESCLPSERLYMEPFGANSSPEAAAFSVSSTDMTQIVWNAPVENTSIVMQSACGGATTCANPIVFESDRDGDREIFMICPDGSNLKQITHNTCGDGRPSISPDGTQIVFVSNCDGNDDIYTMHVDGSNRQRLTTNSGNDWWPMWSPDGTKIVFDSIRPEHEGRRQIYVMNADGSNQQRISFSDIGDDADASWSSDGTKITFWSTRINGQHLDIYSMNADGSNVTLLGTSLYALDASSSYSPDGTKILFGTSGCAGDLDAANRYDLEICVMNADGSGQVKLTDNGFQDTHPRWSLDGTQIVFVSERDGNKELYVMNADGSDQQRMTTDSAHDSLPDWGIASLNLEEPEIGVINKIHQISDSGYIAVGEMSNPTGDPNDHGNKDLWVLRLDLQGNILWQQRYGQPDTWESAMGASVLETPDQGFIVTGGFLQDPDSSAWKILVFKLTGSGDIAWSYTYGQPNSLDFAYDTQLTNDGGCIVIGSTDIFWDTQQRDMWLIKLNAQGQVMWQKAYHLNSELGLKIRATSDNGYVAMGKTQDELVWLKLDANGNIVQQHLYRAANFTWVRDMQLTPDGGVIVSEAQYGDGKIHLMKLDVHGTVEWYQTYVLNTSYNSILSVTVMPDQGYVLTGSAENNRCWLLKVDQTGQVVWQKSFQGLFDAQKSFTSNAALTADGSLTVAGRTWLNDTMNEAFVLKLNADGECCLPSQTHAVSASAGSVTQQQGALTVSTTDVAPLAHTLPAATPNVPVVPLCFDNNDYFMFLDPAHLGAAHDADKTGDNDSNQCWAKAGSNSLSWAEWLWGAYLTEHDIAGYFRSYAENKGSLPHFGMRCVLDGETPPVWNDEWATIAACPEHYKLPDGSYFADAYQGY